MRNRYAILFALSLFAVFTFATSASAASRVIRVSLDAERLAAINSCPETVDFRGQITMNGPGTVKYFFERSDGATSPVRTLHFAFAGTQLVDTSWAIGRSYEGYQKLKVISPNSKESSKAEFNLNCRPVIDTPRPPLGSVQVYCPLETARTEMVTPLRDGWWQTPQIGRLTSIGIQTVGGEQTLVCRYNAYGTNVSVMRLFPEGRSDCRVTGVNRFTCR